MKLELETIQFGTKQTDRVKIQELLDFAKSSDIYSLDTGFLYGNSEQILGEYNLEDFDVVTKTTKIDRTLSRQENFERFRDSFYLSQKRLGYIELHGLMFHDAEDLLSEQGLALWDLVNDFKDKEYVRKLGTVVRTPEQLIEVLDLIDIDIVQIPLNLLDQRFVGLLSELKKKHIEIHTRSTFLQGLLLKNEYQIPESLRGIKPILASIPEPKIATALSLPKYIKEVDKIIVGACTVEDLTCLIDMYNVDVGNLDYEQFKLSDSSFINKIYNTNIL